MPRPPCPRPYVPYRLIATLAAMLVAATAFAQQTDLDAFMARVIERRDDNWKKLQQYVLEERETLQIIGPGGKPIFGSEREYAWFPRDGVFIKSPLRVNGVVVSDRDRRTAEDAYVRRLEQREARRAAADSTAAGDAADPSTLTEQSIRDALEPGFVSAAYFLKFKFDPGHYALAGRERFENRDVLKVEYYPTRLFSQGRLRPNRRVRERDPQVESKMEKAALVTLWIDPTGFQILKYDFRNLPLDFLPGRSIVRVDGMQASMEMGQPFPNVWLPRSIRAGFDLSLALGEVDGRLATDFHDYKLATVTTTIR